MKHSNCDVDKKINYFEVAFHMYMITYMPRIYQEDHTYTEPMICHMYISLHIQHNFKPVKYDKTKRGTKVITQPHEQDHVKCSVYLMRYNRRIVHDHTNRTISIYSTYQMNYDRSGSVDFTQPHEQDNVKSTLLTK